MKDILRVIRILYVTNQMDHTVLCMKKFYVFGKSAKNTYMGKELVHHQKLIFQARDAENMNLHTQIYQTYFCKCFYERYFESY